MSREKPQRQQISKQIRARESGNRNKVFIDRFVTQIPVEAASIRLCHFSQMTPGFTVSEFSHDTTANIRDSRGLLRILEGVGWSDSPDFACGPQGSHRDNVSASFLQRGHGGISNHGPRHFLLPSRLRPYDHPE